MSLIKQVNTELDRQLSEQALQIQVFNEKVDVLFGANSHSELFETAQEFFNSTVGVLKAGKPIDPATAKDLSAKLTALQLMGDSGTRGAALSKIVGDDGAKKLSKIMRDTSPSGKSSNPMDALLIKVANAVGKSGVAANVQVFTTLDKVDEKTRNAKIATIVALANSFKQLESKIQNVAPMNKKPSGQSPEAVPA